VYYSDESVFNDAKALFNLNKNILLKGPTGSGKTKLAALSVSANLVLPEPVGPLSNIFLFKLNNALASLNTSGKTKLAETLSAAVNTPMHQVNCSVDLDAESLLGFKTINSCTKCFR
jgi:nitric oxide reductase NorQ protein